eukprot:7348949-Alexandrium_andersonii.AAC.1
MCIRDSSWGFRAELVRTVDPPHRDERPKLSQPATEQVALDGRTLRLQLEQVAAAVPYLANLLANYRLIRGTAGGLPLIITDTAAERCCELDAIGQVACDWLRAASDPQSAGRVARLAEAVKATASPLLRGNLVAEQRRS